MANALYGKAKEGFLTGQIDWLSINAKVVLIDLASYTADLDLDLYLSDIPVPAIIAISDPLTGKTADLGIADADDITIEAVNGSEFEAMALIDDSGLDSTSRLLIYWDTATGLPLTPNGSGVITTFSPDGIFKF